MLRHSLKHLGLLLALQTVLGAIAFLLSDYRWAAVAVSLLFLFLLWQAGRSFASGHPWRSRWAPALTGLAVGLVWQLPGLQGSIRFLTDTAGWTQYDGITDLQDFAMETWHTVLMPLLGLVPPGQVAGYYARYYILLVLAPLLLTGVLVAGALLPARTAVRRELKRDWIG